MDAHSRSLYWRWVIACTAGEVLGFVGLPVLGGIAALSLTGDLDPTARSVLLYVVSAIGGLGEGAVLALFQVRVLRVCLPRLNARHWVRNTAIAASVAWMCGMLVPLLDDLIGLSAVLQITIWLPASIVILLSIGTAQSWVLRDVTAQPRHWIGANVVGWLLGLPWTFVLPALLPESAPTAIWVFVFLVAGVLMGLTVGLVTGRLVLDMHRRERRVASYAGLTTTGRERPLPGR